MERQCLSAKQRDCGAQRETERNMATAAVSAATLSPEEECVQKGEGWGGMAQIATYLTPWNGGPV